MKNALILTWEKFQDVELVYAYYKLKEEFNVDIIANKQGLIYGINGVKIKSNFLFYENHEFLNSNRLIKLVEIYDLVLMVGGVISIEYLRQNKHAISLIQEFNKQNKIIASICHGSQLLIEADILKNKKISGYYSIQKDIENSGAEYVRGVITDGNIVTAPHYDFQTRWMQEVIRVVNERKNIQ